MTRFLAGRQSLVGAAVAIVTAGLVFIPITPLATVFAGERQPVDHRVVIRDFAFSPAKIAVRPGDTITWTNKDIAPHTATAKDKSWNTGIIRKGQSKTVRVTAEFAPQYYCVFHPAMKARVQMMK